METPVAIATPRPLARAAASLIAAALVVASLAAAAYTFDAAGLRVGPNDYNLAAYELRSFGDRWLYALGGLFRGERSVNEQDRDLVRFLQLNREIEALEVQVSDAGQRGDVLDPARLGALRSSQTERARLENHVEATIERRIGSVAKDLGITRSFLFMHDIVWPPVDLEFTTSPRTLAVSPRDRIELADTSLLREDLTLAEVEAIERRREKRDNVAALAFATGGVGAYPTIVSYPEDYQRALEVAAHEWTHNYLAFRPLGIRYSDSNDLRTMNETVADIVGREVAAAVVAAWPLPAADAAPEVERPAVEQEPPREPRVDAGEALRRLRGEVEVLLVAGRVAEAEALMERRRRELVAQGFALRRLNQAYFAFTNLYAGEAGSPAAVNPIGPKLDELRRRSGSLGAFVRVAGALTSVADLDRALHQAADERRGAAGDGP